MTRKIGSRNRIRPPIAMNGVAPDSPRCSMSCKCSASASRFSTERFSVEPSSVLPHLAQLAHHSSLSDLGAVVSSPGWTRTNNPPVNSRMLCQLSYRGIGGGNCSPPSGEGSDLLPESREALLELDQPIAGGFRELALHRALAQAEEELARRLEGDLVLVPQRVQLGEQRRQLVVGLILSEQVRPCPSVQLVVEVLRAEQLQLRQQRLVRRHAREGAALEPRASVQEPRRHEVRGARTAARG